MDRFTPEQRTILGASLTLSAAVGVFAIAFGVLAVSAGASIVQTCALSIFTFTGASQLSAVGVIATGGSASAAVGGALLLAARNAVYGLALAPHFRDSVGKRLVTAQFVIDETTAMTSAAPDQRSKDWAFWSCALMLFACWNLGTLIGALAGSSIDPRTFGLDAAFPVVFVAMVAPHLSTRNGRRAALTGAAVTIVLTPFLPIGLPILLSSVGVLAGLVSHRGPEVPGGQVVPGGDVVPGGPDGTAP